MAKSVKLEIVTPSELFYRGDVELVICRTVVGDEGFMADHAYACLLLDNGELRLKEAGQKSFKTVTIEGGYVDVKESILVYTDSAAWAEEKAKDVLSA